MGSYLSPLFAQPFEIPGFPTLTASHRIFIHFPIAFICLAWVIELFDFLNERHYSLRASCRRLLFVGSLALVLTYVSGQLSSMRTGIRLSDPAWVAGHSELATTLINHRGMGTLTVLTVSLVAALKYFIFTPARVTARAGQALELAATTVSLFMIALTAHLGGNLSL